MRLQDRFIKFSTTFLLLTNQEPWKWKKLSGINCFRELIDSGQRDSLSAIWNESAYSNEPSFNIHIVNVITSDRRNNSNNLSNNNNNFDDIFKCQTEELLRLSKQFEFNCYVISG